MNARRTELSTEFLARLRAFVRRRVRSEHDAEDIVQDVLVKFARHDDSIDARSISAWLFTVARHSIIDHARAHRAGATLGTADTIADDFDADSSVPAELARCMEPMLDTLEHEDRALLQRVDMLGEPQVEIAREIGISVSGMKSRVQRARRRLRERLEDCCAVELDRLGTPADYQRHPDRPCPCDNCG